MTRDELDNLLFDGFICGCGQPTAGIQRLLDLLRLHPLYEHQAELQQLLPDDGIRMLVLGQLDCADLTEHGATIEGAWLTEKGEAVKAALEAEEADSFEGLMAA